MTNLDKEERNLFMEHRMREIREQDRRHPTLSRRFLRWWWGVKDDLGRFGICLILAAIGIGIIVVYGTFKR